MSSFKIWNGPAPTAAAQASVATGTAVKTMQQIKAGASKGLIITGWGFSLDTAQAAAGTVELLKTDTAATVTAAVAANDIVAIGTPSSAATIAVGVAATGYTASAEGTPLVIGVLDAVKLTVSTTGQLVFSTKFPKDERPYLAPGKILRIRSTTGTSAGMLSWISWIER